MKSLNHKGSLFIITMIATLIVAGCSDGDNKTKAPAANATKTSSTKDTSGKKLKDAPDFSLTKKNGETFTLSDHEGKVLVLNIWATWCPPCRKEIPDFIKMQKEMRDDDVLFAGVSVDREGWEVVRPFAKEQGINYPIMVDDGTVRQKYGPFRGIPTTFIINKKGKIEYVAAGMVNREALKPALEKLANR